MSHPRVLLTGVTGFIGGSILDLLVRSNHPALQQITCLVRGEERLPKLQEIYGNRVKPELYQDVDDLERIIEIAGQHDVVINASIGYHPPSAAALVLGLAKRKQATGKDVYMIHTSGTSNIADRPISGAHQEAEAPPLFDDASTDTYGFEKKMEESMPYGQRTSELGVIDKGIQTGVKTIVIMSGTIYGVGTGHWNKHSTQVPAYVDAAISHGQSVFVGEGKGVWDNVHVEDLADLYELVLLNIIDKNGETLPFGKEGIIFSENGQHSWREVAQNVANAAHAAGKLKTTEIKSVSLEEGARLLTAKLVPPNGSQMLVEVALSSNSRTESSVARKLGWRPTRSDEAWERGFTEEVEAWIARQSAA